jgi:hypothetical protein
VTQEKDIERLVDLCVEMVDDGLLIPTYLHFDELLMLLRRLRPGVCESAVNAMKFLEEIAD